jgi:hypothetical protein
MKKIFSFFSPFVAALSLAIAFAGGFIPDLAEAEDRFAPAGPLYYCSIAGQLTGRSITIGIGGQKIGGDGYISCRTAIGDDVIQIPVRISLFGAGVGLDYSVVHAMWIYSAGIGVVSHPEVFLGTYSVGASIGTTLITAGFDFDAAIKVAKEGGLGFEFGISGKEAVGLGSHAHATWLKIERRSTY